MRTILFTWIAISVLAAADLAQAQSLTLKDGRVVPGTNLRRQGDNVVAAIQYPPAAAGQPATTGDATFPVATIERVDFPPIADFAKVPGLTAQGKGAEALALVEPIVTYLSNFQDIPGSRWDESALLMAQLLGTQGRPQEAQDLAAKIADASTNPELKNAAKAHVALMSLERGDRYQALKIIEPLLENLELDGARAAAFLVKGQILLDDDKWEPALMAFLQVPVFYPGEKLLIPQAMLGRARAHLGLNDFGAARTVLDELAKNYPGTAAGKLAPAELEKVTRREKGVNDAK